MTVQWAGGGIESIPVGVTVATIPAPGVPQPVPVNHVELVTAAAELAAHVADPRPHPEAESGKDFAGWFNALTS